MRSMLVALGAVGIAVSGVVVAPVANAATDPTCPGSGTTEALTGNSESWTVQSPCNQVAWSVGSGISDTDVTMLKNGSLTIPTSGLGVSASDAVTFAYSGSASGTVTVTFNDQYGFGSERSVYTITVGPVSSGSSSSSSSTAETSGPAPLLQQFGMPATGTCDEAQPEGLDWAGVASGGWSTAWGEWMHDGLGGWACSRTLSYSSSQGMWVVD